jgi:Resolvase, N terminal domain
MANALVIRKGTSLTKRDKALRAAQYVRMSTDYQRYSIQNQAAAIAAFAQQKGLTIVDTYIDEGRSGLRIKGRTGLIQLIDDVCSGKAGFDHILVYDGAHPRKRRTPKKASTIVTDTGAALVPLSTPLIGLRPSFAIEDYGLRSLRVLRRRS